MASAIAWLREELPAERRAQRGGLLSGEVCSAGRSVLRSGIAVAPPEGNNSEESSSGRGSPQHLLLEGAHKGLTQ